MNFPLYIAKRYLFSKSSNNAITIISRIALTGIVIGAMALFVVLSVFSGLREFSLTFTNDIDPDLKMSPKTGKSFLVSAAQEKQLQKIPGIALYSKVVEERVLFSFADKQQVSYLKGVDATFRKLNPIPSKLFNGNWLEPQTTQAVIGYGISQKLSLGLYDVNNPLEVFVPKPGKGQIESESQAFNKAYLVPIGIYAISEELDSKYVFVELELAQALMGFEPGRCTALEIKLRPAADEGAVTNSLEKIFGNKTEVKNRAQLNATLYKMLNTENFVLYLIFTLVIIMILFAFAGAVVMVIIDKKDNLKTLFSLGAQVKQLRRVFLTYGISLCALGGIIGILLGAGIVLAQQQLQLVMITNSMAYPVAYRLENVLIVLATILMLGCIATLIASSRVNKKLLE